MPRMAKIRAAAGPLAVTFHRAFDMCANPFNALKNLADAGVARVLTSGQKSDAAQGLSIIMELIAQGDAPIIMAGAGVRATNLQNFLDAGVRKYTVPPESYCLRRCAIAIRVIDVCRYTGGRVFPL
nr:copper homeostasis protein CutC [Salmonella sp. NCTC 7297]